jgi:hypothetical protein
MDEHKKSGDALPAFSFYLINLPAGFVVDRRDPDSSGKSDGAEKPGLHSGRF